MNSGGERPRVAAAYSVARRHGETENVNGHDKIGRGPAPAVLRQMITTNFFSDSQSDQP